MARSRERGTGSVYLKDDPNSPGQKLQTWWISYYIDGKRKRESSKSGKKSDARSLLKRRMGEHALGLEIGEEPKRLTFEDLETGFRRSFENSGRRSLRRAGNAWDRLREHFGAWKARAITANSLESYAADRLNEAAPATVQYELAVLRRAMTLAVKKGQLRSRPHFPHVGVHNARTGFFTREEMEKIATEIGPELGNLVWVAFWTGWRRGELLNLKWADVDTSRSGLNGALSFEILPGCPVGCGSGMENRESWLGGPGTGVVGSSVDDEQANIRQRQAQPFGGRAIGAWKTL
jgi:hypothetical protein